MQKIEFAHKNVSVLQQASDLMHATHPKARMMNSPLQYFYPQNMSIPRIFLFRDTYTAANTVDLNVMNR